MLRYGYWLGSFGLGIAMGGVALGQSPASRFGAIVPVNPPSGTVTPASGSIGAVRGQAPTPAPGTTPMTPGTAPMPGSSLLGPPKVLGNGPSINLERGGTAAPAPMGSGGSVFGTPYPHGVTGAPPSYELAPGTMAHDGTVGGIGTPWVGGGALPGPITMGGADGGLLPTPELESAWGDAPIVGGSGASSAINKMYASAEYLFWWTKSAQVPALVTTSSPLAEGIIGQGDTRVLLGNQSIGNSFHSGARFGLGYWFGCEQRWGIDANAFFLGRNGTEHRFDTGTFPVLARPFFNV
ncbi:MAG: BBP7 family outer membrane beta-barrel protein, partial [Gemmataceae bacterium]